MRNYTHQRTWARAAIAGLLWFAASAAWATEITDRFVPTYRVDEATTFSISNFETSDYVLSWVDDGRTNVVADPVLILSEGVEYTFTRASSAHPFGLLSGAMPTLENFDFSLRRDTSAPDDFLLTTSDGALGNPASEPDSVVWTPAAAGEYHYTCMVPSHADMTGRIRVVTPPRKTVAAIADLAVIDDFGAVWVTNVVPDQVLVVSYTASLTAPFETKAALMVESDSAEVFITGLTNTAGFVRAVVE